MLRHEIYGSVAESHVVGNDPVEPPSHNCHLSVLLKWHYHAIFRVAWRVCSAAVQQKGGLLFFCRCMSHLSLHLAFGLPEKVWTSWFLASG